MLINELIALAKARSGKTMLEMSAEMGHNGHSRLTQINRGRLEPNTSELRYLALLAKVDPATVIAEYESEKHPALAWIWKMTVEPMQNGFASLKRNVRRVRAILKPKKATRRKSPR